MRDAPGAFDIQHHRVVLALDFAAKTVRGEQRLQGQATQTLNELRLSANDLVLTQVEVNGRSAAAERQGGDWVVRLPEAVPAGAALALHARYSGSPAKGIVFEGHAAYTTYFACDWMLCQQDQPGDRASIELVLQVPEGMVAVGPGRRQGDASAQTQVWREARPYPAYLFGFALGAFTQTSVRQGATELLTLSTAADAERSLALFASTGPMLEFFARKAGQPLPQERYVQVHVAGHAAQEFANFAVIGDALISPILRTPEEDWVIAHELAHQWWGNAITCVDWSHFWLNEGVTTFMVAAWKEERWGRAAYEREMTLARLRWARARDAGFDVPLTFGGHYPNLGLRRAIAYSKGALFLDALRVELGEAAFWQALRGYTNEHMGRSVTSRDFQRSVERSSGRELSALFAQWVY